jgi:hypothetical protein
LKDFFALDCYDDGKLRRGFCRIGDSQAALNAVFWAQIPQITANKILEKQQIRLKTADKTDFPRTNISGILVETIQNLHNLAPTLLVSTMWGSSSLSVNLHSQWTPLCLAV